MLGDVATDVPFWNCSDGGVQVLAFGSPTRDRDKFGLMKFGFILVVQISIYEAILSYVSYCCAAKDFG